MLIFTIRYRYFLYLYSCYFILQKTFKLYKRLDITVLHFSNYQMVYCTTVLDYFSRNSQSVILRSIDGYKYGSLMIALDELGLGWVAPLITRYLLWVGPGSGMRTHFGLV